jgi:hypothetical protein
MRFFERAAPKPQDPFEALIDHLDGRTEEIDEARIAEMQYGWISRQGRNMGPMDREEVATIVTVIALLVAVFTLILLSLQRVA